MRRRTFLKAAIIPAAALPQVAAAFFPQVAGAQSHRPLGQAAGAAVAAAVQALPHRIVLPGIFRDGPPLEATVSTTEVFQGGATLLIANKGVSGVATVLGREYTLYPVGETLAAMVGIGVDDPPGETTLTVVVTNELGTVETFIRPLTILATEWTVDYIILPPEPEPDPNEPPPPPPPPDETPLLPAIYAGVTPAMWTPPWTAPLGGELRITGFFGEQRSFNGGPVQGHHGGTDFGAFAGTPIYAINPGRVVLAGLYRIRGNLVVLDHGGGVFSLYGHMNSIAVAEGDVVTRGQVIGEVGSTGLSTGPHLHWELAVGGVLVDGLRWLDGSQGF